MEDIKCPTLEPQSTDTVSTIGLPADEDIIPPVEAPPHTAPQHTRTKIGFGVAKVIEVHEKFPQAAGHTKYDASKISLVAELKQKDSFGKLLTAIPSSAKGRYQSISPDDKSLMPIGTEDEDGPSVENIGSEQGAETATKDSTSSSREDENKQKGSIVRALLEKRQQATQQKIHGVVASDETQGTKTTNTTEGGVKRDSLVATVTVVTNLMKWQLKSKNKAGAKLQSMEKYKGHLEVIQRRSRQEQVDIPFPIRLSIRREVLPIIHSIAKEYRLALGHDHKLTREAMAKEKQLRSELTGEGVYL